MRKLNFSINFLKWTLSYSYGRKHFVQVNTDISTFLSISCGVHVPIHGPVLFNLRIADMPHIMSKCQCLQYTNDTTIYTHCKIKNLKVTEQNPDTELNNLVTWSNETNLVFSSSKTKLMVIASKQITCIHNLYDQVVNIRWEDKHL